MYRPGGTSHTESSLRLGRRYTCGVSAVSAPSVLGSASVSQGIYGIATMSLFWCRHSNELALVCPSHFVCPASDAVF